MVYRCTPLLIAVLLGGALLGCSNTPKDPEQEVPPEVDEIMGRDRPDYENKGPLESMFSGGDDGDEGGEAAEDVRKRLEQLEQRAARMEQQLLKLSRDSSKESPAAGTQRPAIAGLTPPVGLLLPTPDAPGELGGALQSAVADAAGQSGVRLVRSAAVAERLDESGCREPDGPGCLSDLAAYPGVRMLVAVQSIDRREDVAVVNYRLMDTILGHVYAERTARLPASAGEVSSEALSAFAESVLFTSLTLADKAPWQTRAFNQRGDRWFLSAGEVSGLEVGDRLTVHEAGRTISTPGGNVAGWVPGPRKGVLEIVEFAGSDVAVARLVEGREPTPDDPVLAADAARSASSR